MQFVILSLFVGFVESSFWCSGLLCGSKLGAVVDPRDFSLPKQSPRETMHAARIAPFDEHVERAESPVPSLRIVRPRIILVTSKYADVPVCMKSEARVLETINAIQMRDQLTSALVPSFGRMEHTMTEEWRIGSKITETPTSVIYYTLRSDSGVYVLKYFSNCRSLPDPIEESDDGEGYMIGDGVEVEEGGYYLPITEEAIREKVDSSKLRAQTLSTDRLTPISEASGLESSVMMPEADEMTREYALGAFIGEAGIGPSVQFLSGPALWTGAFTNKFSDKKRRECTLYERKKASVRFMIMDKVGLTVNEIMKNSMEHNRGTLKYLEVVISLVRNSLKKISELHALGIVHGDIHGSNIALKDPEVVLESFTGDEEILLIDFGMSGFVHRSPLTNRGAAYPMLSIWQLEDEGILGFRDDVFRLFESLANYISARRLGKLMTRVGSEIYSQSSESRRETYREMKAKLNYFSVTKKISFKQFNIGFDSFKGYQVSRDIIDRVRNPLEKAMDYLKKLPANDEMVNFKLLDKFLADALAVIKADHIE